MYLCIPISCVYCCSIWMTGGRIVHYVPVISSVYNCSGKLSNDKFSGQHQWHKLHSVYVTYTVDLHYHATVRISKMFYTTILYKVVRLYPFQFKCNICWKLLWNFSLPDGVIQWGFWMGPHIRPPPNFRPNISVQFYWALGLWKKVMVESFPLFVTKIDLISPAYPPPNIVL